ncbi:hypothetical protein [Actinophytocola sp.]|uniref:hypothetical protein n=1 Tax=Actinophytocola sp. TaxID=1872138 RepID=UPI00389A1FE9
MSEADTTPGSWDDWPEQVAREARSAVECVRTGSPVDAMAALDKMIVEINRRRAVVAELANTLD